LRDDGDGVLHVAGEIDAATAPELRRRLGAAPVVSVLDMRDVTFLDSSGITALLLADDERDGAEHLTVRAPSVQVRRVLELTGLVERFGLDDTAGE
jgi:anti-anti-sigma factor